MGFLYSSLVRGFSGIYVRKLSKLLLSNRYYITFFAISLVAFLVFYFVDYLFYSKVEEHFTDATQLAQFFGIFIALLNGVNLISSLFISSKILGHYGISISLLLIPFLMLVGLPSILLSLSFVTALVFFIVVIVKLLNEVLDISILTPSFRVLYQAIPNAQRNRVIAFRETIVEPFAMGLAGLSLLLISSFESLSIIYYVLFFLTLVWLVLAKVLVNDYLIALKKIINNRIACFNTISFNTLDIDIFIDMLKRPNEIEIIYAIESLNTLSYDKLESVLKQYIDHSSDKVQLSVLKIIKEKELYHLSDDVVTLLQKNKCSNEVLAYALQTYAKLFEADAIELLNTYLDSTDLCIQDAAVISLMRYCGIDGILSGGVFITYAIDEGSEKNKLRILNILDQIDIIGFYKFLKLSLEDTNNEIKNFAIKVVGNLKIKRFINTTPIQVISATVRVTGDKG